MNVQLESPPANPITQTTTTTFKVIFSDSAHVEICLLMTQWPYHIRAGGTYEFLTQLCPQAGVQVV